jgi:hypothetical protein
MVFKNRYDFLHATNPLPNILYEPSSDAYFDSFLDEEMRILISVNLVKIKTIFEHHITHFSKCRFEGVVLNIRDLPLTVFLDSYISETRNFEWA